MTDNLPPPVVMMQMINGMVVSRCISLAADLAIADQLAEGPREVASLASATSSDADTLYRVLRTLAGLGIFAELADRRFENTPMSEVLRSDARGSLRPLARWLGHPFHWRTLGGLDFSVATGRPVVERDHPGRNPFDVLAADTDAHAVYNQAMTGLSMAHGAAIMQAYDFAPYRRIVDVGGGHGTMAINIARAAPSATVTVYDIPEVVEGARENLNRAGVASQVETIGGSLLEKVPGPADLYLLKHILHLMDDATAKVVLSHCRGGLADGGRVLVCEMLITPGPDSVPARILDIEMMIGTGGRERSEAEFARLFAAAGLKLERVLSTFLPMRLLEASAA